MRDEPVMAVANFNPGLLPVPINPYKPMTFQRHQELTALAYRVKKYIDSEGGLKENEACEFGRMVQSIIFLK